jgi:hypothetical protein
LQKTKANKKARLKGKMKSQRKPLIPGTSGDDQTELRDQFNPALCLQSCLQCPIRDGSSMAFFTHYMMRFAAPIVVGSDGASVVVVLGWRTKD